jgi:diguanylate cyclase (GGDEF)-like protein
MTESYSTADLTASPPSGATFFARAPEGEERAEPREKVNARSRLLILLLCLGAFAGSLGAGYVGDPRSYSWTTFVILATAAAVAQLFGVLSPHNQSYHLAIVFVVAGALLLPPELVALLCVVLHVPEWVKDKLPIEIQSFNIANYTLAALGGSVATRLVMGPNPTGVDTRTLVAGLAAGAVFVLLNHGVLAGMLRVARGHSLRQSGLFTVESLTTDLVLALIGVGLAAWWNVNLWFLPVAVAPLLLIHRALSIPTLRAEASRDPKTGLYNAGFLNSSLTDEMERAVRFERPLSVIVADLDFLRKINNSYGHLAGDAVLLGVADVFRQELRPYDVAARFGGEEFAVVLPETEFDEAMAIAERIRKAVEEDPFRRKDSSDPVPATLSLGVSSYPLHAGDTEQLVHQADLALYRAKALGRNRVCGATGDARVLNRLIEVTNRDESAEEPRPRGFHAYRTDRATENHRPTLLERARALFQTVTARASEAIAAAKPAAETAQAARHVRWLIAMLVTAAAGLLVVSESSLVGAAHTDILGVASFTAVVLALQLLSVDLYGTGAEAASAIGILATTFTLGPGVGIAVAVLAALTQWIRRHGLFHRALFDAANFALSAGAAGYLYLEVAHTSNIVVVRFAGAVLATIAYKTVNTLFLCLVMSMAESTKFTDVWRERFRWASLHYLAYAPLAFAAALAYEKMGLVGLAAFTVPPALFMLSVRQYLGHTKQAVENVRKANEELKLSNAELAASNQRVRKTHLDTITALSKSMEAKDYYTGGHNERVSRIAVAMAYKLGYRGDELEAIQIGGLLHDIGKIGIPESIITKPGPLTEEEWAKMREHPVISDYILSEIDLHPFVRQIARSGHERIDGQGYPDGLAGNEIPLPARIVLVADAFDALTTDRAYRAGTHTEAALREIRAHAGTQFCMTAVEALEQIYLESPDQLDHGQPELLHAEVA